MLGGCKRLWCEDMSTDCFFFSFFFFQAEDGIRDKLVTGVQTCALPISWVERMRTPQNLRVAIRELQQAMGAEVREYFEIGEDGTFSTDVLVLWAEK